jgi:hypothetical protein
MKSTCQLAPVNLHSSCWFDVAGSDNAIDEDKPDNGIARLIMSFAFEFDDSKHLPLDAINRLVDALGIDCKDIDGHAVIIDAAHCANCDVVELLSI